MLSCVFVGDDAFSLLHHLLKLFPAKNLTTRESISNYRLSRARLTAGNAFGLTHLEGFAHKTYKKSRMKFDYSVRVKKQSRYTPWRRLGGEEV
jgi:hypothetical protein